VLCQNSTPREYSTTGQANATNFEWKLEPSNAGLLNANWTLCTVQWDSDFHGIASLSVKQLTSCGTSAYSTPLTIQLNPLPIVNLGADQIVPANASVVLDAGNPGATYLWNTGETTSSISVDSTGNGLGTSMFWVQVTNPASCLNSDTVFITFSTNIGIDEDVSSTIAAYPNPLDTKTWINIGPCDATVDYWLMNAQGECLQQNQALVRNHGFWLNLEPLPSGVYILKLQLDSSQLSLKLLVR
jgi:hypothetical protein